HTIPALFLAATSLLGCVRAPISAMKRKRSGQEYDEDEKLLHQATKALTKEAKRVKTFLLQQAIRKSRAAADKKKKNNNHENKNKNCTKNCNKNGEGPLGRLSDENITTATDTEEVPLEEEKEKGEG
ncbi:unnamed protein product, partial [Pylaiella littoralis]